MIFATAFLAACGGGGAGDGGNGGGNNPPPSGQTVQISGKITFDRVPFKTTLRQGLNPGAAVESPARGVLVEAIRAGAVSASTTTDANGDYTLTVPANASIFLRVKAQMVKEGAAPTWNFRVLNNTNGDALYAVDGTAFDTGSANSTRNLRAQSGWDGANFGATRPSAPFAILDTIYRARTMINTAQPNASFPALNLYWSTENKDTGTFCPDNGSIGTSFYIGPGQQDNCAPRGQVPEGIYVLGWWSNGNGDTDEFDAHVIAHEFGHYVEDKFSRSDSFGGDHSLGDKLDLRLAFGEGYGNAFGGMALNDPEYRDSRPSLTGDTGFNIDSDFQTAEGWYSEASVAEILWDVFDGPQNDDDTVALGFAPIFAVMTEEQRNTDALTSIYSFTSALRADNGGSAGAIAQLLGDENIEPSDEFGSSETDNGGSDVDLIPIYTPINIGQSIPMICASNAFGDGNKLGYTRFLRLNVGTATNLVISVQGASNDPALGDAAQDPDIYVYRRGELFTSAENQGANDATASRQFPAGTYVIEVYDFTLTGNVAPRCMTVNVIG